MSQIVDTVTAKEFMKETLERIEEHHLVEIVDALQRKSEVFKHGLDLPAIEKLPEKKLNEIIRHIFSIRRKSKRLFQEVEYTDLIKYIGELLHGSDDISKRFQVFCQRLDFLDEHIRYDFAGELLHFTFPDKYWLWCHWMWNPKTKTGSLPLVTTEDFDLAADQVGDGYMRVGKAVAFVHEVGKAAGFQTISRSLFGTDVYLSCVYVIYAYTVLRMRMTQEFNQVMPGVVEFSKRILGVYDFKE